jgi:hypothetical protein
MTYIPLLLFFNAIQEPFHDCFYTSARTHQYIGPPIIFNTRRQLNIITTDALLETDVSTNVVSMLIGLKLNQILFRIQVLSKSF